MHRKLNLFLVIALLAGGVAGAWAAGTEPSNEFGPEALPLSPRLPELDAGVDSPASPALDTVCPAVVLPGDGSASANGRGPIATIRFERTVYLLTAAELSASGFPAGSVSGIGWNYALAPGVTASGSLVVYLENTADTTNAKSTTWAAALAGMTTVHNATTILPAVSGPFDVTFAGGAPFTYTGGGLYVAFDWQYPSGTLSNGMNVCSTTLAAGTKSGLSNSVPVASGLVSSNFRAETRLTSGGGTMHSDASVDVVIAPGSLPVGLVGPQILQAVITNRGTNPLIDLPVSMNITGPDARSSSVLIGSLAACGGRVTVSFPPFTPAALGSDVITVSVPADDVPSNNSVSRPMDETLSLYSYKHPGTAAAAGVGLTGSTGAIVSKFTTTVATRIVAVNLEFFAAGATQYRVAIYADSGSATPWTTPLYVDAADRSVSASGPVTIQLATPLSVGPGNFYVGIHQTNAINASLSADPESPIRAGVQFMALSLPPTSWFDFAPGNDFTLNIGVVVDRCNVTPTVSNEGPVCAGGILQLGASAANAVTYGWTGPNGFTSSQRTPSISNATVAASGAYTVTVNGCASSATTLAVVRAEGDACATGDDCTSHLCTSGVCQAMPMCTVVNPGVDLLSTPTTGSTYDDLAATPVPVGFFNPGSDSFAGRITFRGMALNAGLLGTTDTIVKRNSTAILRGAGGSATIDVEVAALSLTSINPITVTYGGASPELWDVRVCLSNTVAQAHGTMTITAGPCRGEGGTFTSTLYVSPRLVFRRRGDNLTRVLDPVLTGAPPMDFHSDHGHWVEVPDAALALRTITGSFSVDKDCDGDLDGPFPATSNFFPGVRSGHCSIGPSGAVIDCGSQKKRVMVDGSIAYAAGHVTLPTQEPQADSDGDGIVNDSDNCTGVTSATANPLQEDADDDAIGDPCDNCPAIPSCDQSDLDQDDLGDLCDPDSDNDGVMNGLDNCPTIPNASQADLDSDSLGDACDPDRDGDGVANASDNCPSAANGAQTDTDADGVGDACDNCDLAFNPIQQSDFDGDGEGDRCDLNDGLIWEWRDNRTSVAWQAEQGPTSWNVYTGSMNVLQATGVYTQVPGSNAVASRQCGVVSLTAPDGGVPSLGTLSFSLVTGVTGATEGSLGSSSTGPRANTSPCP